MSWIDWAIVITAVIGLRYFSGSTRKYMKSVADFLAANRVAGRYLLTLASPMSSFGAFAFVALFQMYATAGFTIQWWGFMNWAGTIVILLSGWVFYRYRQTRAMTMAQFYEMRYTRPLRIFMGIVSWVTGMIVFGIVPAVTARFFIHYCGLPEHFTIPGVPFEISTLPVVMAIDLALAMTFVTMGGQISVLITDCIQGIFTSFVAFVAVIALLWIFPWPTILEGLNMAPAGKSMLNPFQSGEIKDFNLWFVLIGIFASFYGYPGSAGAFGTSAKTPHEQKMGAIIGVFRGMPLSLLQSVPAIALTAVLLLPQYAGDAAAINEQLQQVSGGQQVQDQMRIPMAMSYFLPIGIKGLLATAMIFFSITACDASMHTMASTFIQDVVMPFRSRPIEPRQHMKLLRWSVIGVSVFAFVFSLVFPVEQPLILVFAAVGAIAAGGAGACIVGGLYWRKGTTAGAYASVTISALIGLTGLVWPIIHQRIYGREFPINGQWVNLVAMLASLIAYVIVSLMTCQRAGDFDLDRLLHRGRYAEDGAVEEPPRGFWRRLVGTGSEFTKSDKFIASMMVVWNLSFVVIYIIITTMHFTIGEPDWWWAKFWYTNWIIHFVIGIPVTILVSIGAIRDMRALFRSLATDERDHSDDGWVAQHHVKVASAPTEQIEVESKPVLERS
jgi:SSS family solute:Na+ symporter